MLLDPDGDYYARAARELFLNGKAVGSEKRSVASLFDLWPATEYKLESFVDGKLEDTLCFTTKAETCTFNVRSFGAAGDGEKEDTGALQAAILCCPAGGRVMIPAGVYRTAPLFLKSHITLEIKKGATLALLTDRKRFPVLPGVTLPPYGGNEYILGSWEGNPLDCFASALNGIDVEDVQIIGQGVIDGCAGQGDWWVRPKEKRLAYRGNLFYLRNCSDITVQGISFRNSPSWNLHPCFSSRLSFIGLSIEAPSDSPNTDGFDPESCDDVRMLGTVFSVGDDCIAIKSGKIYMGQKYHRSCADMEIAWCAMLDGHGGVTVGSEMAGGVRDIRVHHCLMRGNDRGLRIKTRRGRGRYGIIDGIRFEDVRMINVKVPLVINCMYYCDPDGHSPFVQSRHPQPVDETTPSVGQIVFERVCAEEMSACIGYVLGLPENPVAELVMRDCSFSFAEDTVPMIPAMAEDVEPCSNSGLILRYIQSVILQRIKTAGVYGETVEALHTGSIIMEDVK